MTRKDRRWLCAERRQDVIPNAPTADVFVVWAKLRQYGGVARGLYPSEKGMKNLSPKIEEYQCN